MDETTPGPTPEQLGLNRRAFAAGLAALATGVALPSAAEADEPKTDDPIPLNKAYEALVRDRCGKHLTDEQVKLLSRRVMGQKAQGDALHRVSLTNGDEPAFIFQADL